MSKKAIKLLEVRDRPEWRRWLKKHFNSEPEIWLIFRKGKTAAPSLSYTDAVEEALCFGWIDSLVRRLDDVRYARKFTPRRAESRWSSINRSRYEEMKSRGLLTAAGVKLAPTSRSGDAPRPSVSAIPSYIEERLKTNPPAWRFFEGLAPSYRRAYIAWIEAAKRDETREKRLCEALSLLGGGKKPGLK